MKKKVIILIVIVILISIIATAVVFYIVNMSFREWIDIHILQKEIEHNDVAVIDFNSNANIEICAYDKYIGISPNILIPRLLAYSFNFLY